MSSVDYVRFRMAIHEGAHCVAAHHHGYRIGAASIMLESGGCVWYSSAPATPEYEPTFTGSVLHIPAAERRWLEGKACVTLAGPVAEAIYAPEMQGGYSPPEASVEDLERLTADRLRLPAGAAGRSLSVRFDDAPSERPGDSGLEAGWAVRVVVADPGANGCARSTPKCAGAGHVRSFRDGAAARRRPACRARRGPR